MDNGYFVSNVKCKNCGKEWVAVRPDTVEDERLECPNCGKCGAEEIMEEEHDE